jgi:signal transduction histidine kinase
MRSSTELQTPGAPGALALEQAMATLSGISGRLLESYGELERRAQRVEEELCRTNSELEIKVSELDRVTRHLEAVLEALPTGVVVRDAGGRIVRANPAATDILGADLQGLLERSGEIPGLLGERAAGEVRELECLDGERRVIWSRFSPIDGAGTGEGSGSVEILDDRTELTELSERLHSLDKLAALGNMAGGIAHEIRNPMNAVKGFGALIAKHAPAGSRQKRWATRIVEGVDEADAILASMLTLATPERLTLETIDARELVESAIALVQPEADRAGEQARITSDARAISFPGDRIKLRQALRNLIVNAIEAQESCARVHVTASVQAGEVVLCVSDAGPGIPAHVKPRIFDPFYTTRPEGTGLGLALVSAICRLHGGQAVVSSKSGLLGGADISLRIPSARNL